MLKNKEQLAYFLFVRSKLVPPINFKVIFERRVQSNINVLKSVHIYQLTIGLVDILNTPNDIPTDR